MISLFDSAAAGKKEAPDVKSYDFYEDFQSGAPSQEVNEPENRTEEDNPWGAIFESEYRRRIEQAEEILNAARQEAESIRKEAFAEGRESGFQAGFEEGEVKAYADHQEAYDKELNMLRHEIAAYIQDMGNKKDKVLEKYIDDLKDIALTVAEKVIHTSLRSSGEIVRRMIISNTEKLKKTSWVKIYVGKEEPGISIQGDAEFIRELSKLSDNVKIVVMNEEPGTCIIELPNEIIDVSVGTQLENIRGILENARL